MATYSFLDVHVIMAGPGGFVSLGAGAGDAKEGITIEFAEDKNRMVVGADGSVMHSLIASKGGKATVRLLKTSSANSQLAGLYNYQTTSSLFHGKNVFTLSNPVTGDTYVCSQAAFKKFPKNDWAEEGGTLDWEFDVGVIDPVLGAATLPLAA